MAKRKWFSSYLGLAVVLGNLAVWQTLLADPGGPGGGDPEEAALWEIKVCPPLVNVNADLTTSGNAAVASHAYSIYVVRDSDGMTLQSGSGTSTSSTPYTWTKTLAKPGSAWPVCTAKVKLFVDNVVEDEKPTEFKQP